MSPLFLTLIACGTSAEAPTSLEHRVDDVTLDVTYQPEPVSWTDGTPWALPGARITVPTDVLVNRAALPAGAYSMVVIPYRNEWVVSFRTADPEAPYNREQDAIRLAIPPSPRPSHDRTVGITPVEQGLVLGLDDGEVVLRFARDRTDG